MQDYFAVLGLPVLWQVTSDVLAAAFHRESRLSHPDRYYGKPEASRRAAMSRTTDLTTAYRTLKELPTRARYLIETTGKTLSETGGAKVAPELLTEVLEGREAALELRAQGPQALPQLVQLGAVFHAKLSAVERQIEQQFAAADAGTPRPDVADALLLLLAQHKYLFQTVQEIERAKSSLGA